MGEESGEGHDRHPLRFSHTVQGRARDGVELSGPLRYGEHPARTRRRASAPSSMHLKMGIFPQALDLDVALPDAAALQLLALFGTAILPRLPGRYDERFELLRRCPFPKGSAKIETVLGVQTQVPQSVSRQSAPIAG